MNIIDCSGQKIILEEWSPLGHKKHQLIDYAFKKYYTNITALLIRPQHTFLNGQELELTTIANIAIEKNNVDLVIIQSSEEYAYPTIFKTINIKKPYIYLVADWDEFNLNHPNICYFPFWVFGSTLLKNFDINAHDDFNRKFLVSCINRRITDAPHRIFNILRLIKKPYIDDIYWTMYNFQGTSLGKLPYYDLSEEVVNEYNNLVVHLPKLTLSNSDCITDTNDPAFLNSYLNIVTESHFKFPMVSEKSFKPFLGKQMPIYIGSQGIVRYIRSLGFDLFDDIIDHAYYDNESSWEKRIEKIHELLDHLSTLDFAEIFQKTVERRLKNLEYLRSEKFIDHLMHPVTQKIDNILNL